MIIIININLSSQSSSYHSQQEQQFFT